MEQVAEPLRAGDATLKELTDPVPGADLNHLLFLKFLVHRGVVGPATAVRRRRTEEGEQS